MIVLNRCQLTKRLKLPLLICCADEAATISLNPTSYVVDESDGVVNIIVEKTGFFSQPIQGTVTTVATGSASGEKLFV